MMPQSFKDGITPSTAQFEKLYTHIAPTKKQNRLTPRNDSASG